MRTMTEQEARERFDDALEATRTGPVVICRGKEEVGVLISPEDYEALREIRARRFDEVCDDIAAKAKARGLTPEIFEGLMRDVS